MKRKDKWIVDLNNRIKKISERENPERDVSLTKEVELKIPEEYVSVGKKCDLCNNFIPHLKHSEKYCEECIVKLMNLFGK